MYWQEKIPPLLLSWWDEGHAHLPWRDADADAYAVWVAEIMLQQTRLSTVIPYYHRWMERFPTVADLAASELDDVLKLWEGLGYYSRARNMHSSAKEMMRRYDGRLPDTVRELMTLKGIGRYTAGAIASIAYDRPEPLIDGNVTRVLSRLLDIPDDVTTSPVKKRLWQIAGSLVPEERSGDYNQALMELGQTLCQVVDPQCHRCPLRGHCLSRRRGTQLTRPVRPPRQKTPHFDVTAGVIWGRNDHLLIARRPIDGLLGGLWEFPGGKVEAGETLEQALVREIKEELDIRIEVGPPLSKIRHAYTHYRITLHPFHARHVTGKPCNLGVAAHAWVVLNELDAYAFPVTDRKIIEQLQNGSNPDGFQFW